jgi:hypothetical protein
MATSQEAMRDLDQVRLRLIQHRLHAHQQGRAGRDHQ